MANCLEIMSENDSIVNNVTFSYSESKAILDLKSLCALTTVMAVTEFNLNVKTSESKIKNKLF